MALLRKVQRQIIVCSLENLSLEICIDELSPTRRRGLHRGRSKANAEARQQDWAKASAFGAQSYPTHANLDDIGRLRRESGDDHREPERANIEAD